MATQSSINNSNVQIVGGSIDNTTIGSTTATTGKFTVGSFTTSVNSDLINNFTTSTPVSIKASSVLSAQFTSTANFLPLPTGINVSSINSSTKDLELSSTADNRKLVLYNSANNSHQFYGFGINAGIFRYQVDQTGSDHVFYAATSTTTSSELFRVLGVGGIKLPTSGGTATALDFYETGTFTLTGSGPWATSHTATIGFSRIGNIVFWFVPVFEFANSATSSLTISGIPSRLTPTRALTSVQTVRVMNGGTIQTSLSDMDLDNVGGGTVYKDQTGASFSGAGNCGIHQCMLSYTLS